MSLLKKLRERLGLVDPLGGLDRQAWLAQVRAAAPEAIAVVHPHWLGVAAATGHHFPFVLPLCHRLSELSSRRLADLLRETGVRRIVLSGYSPDMHRLTLTLSRRHPQLALFAYWHSSLMQAGERTGWQGLTRLVELTRERRLRRLAFAKAGMAELTSQLGADSVFLPTFVPGLPEGPSAVRPGGPHLGLWAVNSEVWRKLPYAMLAAARQLPGAVVHMSGASPRVLEYAGWLGLEGRFHSRAFPPAEMPARLASMHLNLYVTLSECSPMVPQESLAAGVPCLMGPNSHLFEDEPYLHDRLVVAYPDRHEVIASYLRRALDERAEIVEAYRRYAPGYWQRAADQRRAFLGLENCGDTAGGKFADLRRIDAPHRGVPVSPPRHSPAERAPDDETGATS